MVGGLIIIGQQTDNQEEGLGYLWTPAEVLSAVYPDSEPQGSFICQVEWRDRGMRSPMEKSGRFYWVFMQFASLASS